VQKATAKKITNVSEPHREIDKTIKSLKNDKINKSKPTTKSVNLTKDNQTSSKQTHSKEAFEEVKEPNKRRKLTSEALVDG